MQDYEEMMRDTFDEITQIGAGGGGTVFKAHHKRLDKDVVLKKIHTDQLKNINHRAELNILKNLKHNYVPQILDFIEFGDDVFTIMEYIPGKSFAQLLKQQQSFSQKDVVKWLQQLCEVVEYLHSRTPPIIHCDIKPDNVMLTPAGDICLIDFNISGVKSEEGIAAIGYSNGYAPVEQFAVVARQLENATGIGTEISISSRPEADRTEILSSRECEPSGTYIQQAIPLSDAMMDMQAAPAPVESLLSSMSNEEWVAAKQAQASVGEHLLIDERTDIYSIGATFYHILTGKKPKPFYEEQDSLSESGQITEGLVYVIEKAMKLRPSDRFRDSRELLKTVRNMAVVDQRYKVLSRKQIISAVLTGVMVLLSIQTVARGRSVMAQENWEQYQFYIKEMEAAREDRDYDMVEADYELALELSHEEMDAYYEMAMAYYEQKRYEECIDYLSVNVYSNSAIAQDEGYGRFYYITGSCYFELEDYVAASSYYEKALALQPEQIAYYRDYVVALARNGNMEQAETVLREAEDKGVSADVLNLLKGEIALLRKEYPECEQYLSECLADTEDSYIRVRACSRLDELYQQMYEGSMQYEKRIAMLTDALEILSADSQVTLMERLAQAYIDYSDIGDRDACCESAISLFVQMEERGYATFISRYNVVVLYEKMARFEEAREQLEQMQEFYPDNYIIFKRKAFVELETQAEKENGERDYRMFQEYYQKAWDLYEDNAQEDVEMLSLRQLYLDLVQNGWL